MMKKLMVILVLIAVLTACGTIDGNEATRSNEEQGGDGQTDVVGSEDEAKEDPLASSDGAQPSAADSSQLVTYGVAGYVIEVVEGESEGEMSILVEGELGKNGADYDKAYVKLTGDTVVYGTEEVDSTAIEVGQYVRVFFDGPVMESYPVQATAGQVNIVPEEALVFQEDSKDE